jgi:hypothetical protein
MPEAARIGTADAPEPDLGVGDSSHQAIRSGQLVGIHLVGTRFDVNRDKLVFLASPNTVESAKKTLVQKAL